MKGRLSAAEAPSRLSAASVLLGIAVGYGMSVLAAGLLGLLMFRINIPDPTATSSARWLEGMLGRLAISTSCDPIGRRPPRCS